MRLAELRKLSKSELEIETKKSLMRIQKAYEKLSKIGVWHPQPKDFPKKVNNYILWEKK